MYLTFVRDSPCPDPDILLFVVLFKCYLIFLLIISLLYNLDILFVVFGFWQLINIIDTVDILPPNFVTLE